jgi:hypothetical protein
MAESKLAVFGAIAANAAIAAMKFAGAAATGSSAMLSEGIHSLVDTGDGVLLLVGMRLANRPADERHPFGYGKELYFRSLIVAVLIFGVGGGVSIYEGILRLIDRRALDDAGWSYAILAAAAVFEGASLAISVRPFKKSIGDEPFCESLRTSKDPTLSTVIAEDSSRDRRPRRRGDRRLRQPHAANARVRRRRVDRHRPAALRCLDAAHRAGAQTPRRRGGRHQRRRGDPCDRAGRAERAPRRLAADDAPRP